MILTVEAFKRETRGGIPLNQVKQLSKAEANRVIPQRIRNGEIYGRLQQALDNEKGLDDDDDDPLDDLAAIMDGLTGFNSTSAYTEQELLRIFDDLIDDGGAAVGGPGSAAAGGTEIVRGDW